MTIFDYLVLFVLITSVIISTMRGLVKEVLSVVSWVAAFMAANAFGQSLALMLPLVIPGAVTRLICAFVLLFIGVRLLMMLLSMALEAIIEASGLKPADKGLGGLFGLARGTLIVLTVVLLCGTTSIPKQDFWRSALFSPLAESAALTMMPFLPVEVSLHV